MTIVVLDEHCVLVSKGEFRYGLVKQCFVRVGELKKFICIGLVGSFVSFGYGGLM